MRSIPLRSAFGIEARDSKGLGFYPDGAFGNEPYLAQAMMGIDVDNNVYSAQVPTTSVYENDIWYEKSEYPRVTEDDESREAGAFTYGGNRC